MCSGPKQFGAFISNNCGCKDIETYLTNQAVLYGVDCPETMVFQTETV